MTTNIIEKQGNTDEDAGFPRCFLLCSDVFPIFSLAVIQVLWLFSVASIKLLKLHLLLLNAPRIFGQICGQVFDQIFGQGFGGGQNYKYSVQYYPA